MKLRDSHLMLHCNGLRIVMALMMATWSPMWCQCVLLTAARGHCSAAETQAVEPCRAIESCSDEFCTGTTERPAFVTTCWLSGRLEAPADGPCSCQCCDQRGPAGATQQPSLNLNLKRIPAGECFIAILPALVGAVHRLNFAPFRQRCGPAEPSTTLLRLRCLFLI